MMGIVQRARRSLEKALRKALVVESGNDLKGKVKRLARLESLVGRKWLKRDPP